MTNRRTLMRAALGVAAAMTIAGSAQAQEVTLRMHQFLPAGANVPQHILHVWADNVEAASDGRIKIDRFDGMALGGTPPSLYDQVVDGVVDIVWTLPGYTPGRFPRAEVFELPFMMTNAEDTSRAYWRLGQEAMIDADFADVHVLGLWVHGPGVIHSEEPVRGIADLQGVKLRAPTQLTNSLFTNLGATTIGLPVPAIPEALSKGVIDAAVIPWEVTTSLKIAELVDNHTEFADPLYVAAFVFAMNRASYDRLPDDLKAVIDAQSGEEFSAFAGRTMQQDDGPARQIAVDAGNTIVTIEGAALDEWRAASQGTVDAWLAEMAAKDIDGAALKARAEELIGTAAGG